MTADLLEINCLYATHAMKRAVHSSARRLLLELRRHVNVSAFFSVSRYRKPATRFSFCNCNTDLNT